MLRFHLDENVDHAVVTGLRARGVDVTTTPQASLKGAADEEQIAYGLRERRVILTHDEDFLQLAAAGVQHAGIVYCRTASRTVGQIVLRLVDLSRRYEPPDFLDRVEYL